MQGLTFEQIAHAMNKDEVWVAALFYGQVSSILLGVCVEYTSR
jgi:cyanate lyase